ncbi:hypothetical protein V6N12_027730 [Hibiscus sabdariffa]|uniref:Uncharacterized protein n=1 Tax=Hibiscus sabdariffa TaxID=183260 RepID=A0ABR2F3R9_9ROSI
MSRCFPFPPPGYEKKARTDDVDLLNKDFTDLSIILLNVFLLTSVLTEPLISHSGEKFIQKEKGTDQDRSSFSGEKKLAGHISGYNGEKIGQNSHLVEDFRDSKFVQDLAGRVRDEGAGAGSQLVDKFKGSDQKKDEGMVSFVAKSANKLAEEKEKIKKSDDRKFNVQGIKEETRAGGNAIVPTLAGAAKARVEGFPKQVENNAERRGEGKEKIKEKGDDKIRDKRKEKDREKKSHGKDKDRDKTKEEKEKEKAKGEHRYLELDNLKGNNKVDPLRTVNLKTSNPFKEGNKGDVADENLRKRKYLEKNGFLHVDDVKPNKLPKISSSQPLTGNGKTMESYQAPIPLTLDSKGPGSSPKIENKELKVNDIVKAQLSSFSPTKHLSSSAQASKITEVSIKPPHPDSKYLSQVLSVPKMEEWSGFDDQSWLFHSSEPQSKKPKVGFSEIDEPPQVWAEALQIESADVYALPYVIPY